MAKVRGNLTEGPILKVLAELALPIMASAFLATAYNITDMAWVGMLGAKAVAGVGVGGMYVWLSQGLSTLAKVGGQVYVAQALGEGKREEAKKYGIAALQMGILFGMLFGAICLCFTNPLVSFFGLTDEVAIYSAKTYLKIACGLVIFSYISQILTGIYTAQGDSKTPLKANFFGLVMNMILDPMLILGIGPFPRMEAAGAAFATVIAQMVVMIVLILECKNGILAGGKIFTVPEYPYWKKVGMTGWPIALQTSVYCMISMVLSRLVGSFGDDAIAIQRVGGQIESISWNTADGFSTAMNAFAAQNYGARNMERVKKGYSISMLAVGAWGAIVALIFFIIPEPISAIFFHEADVIRLSVDYLMIIGVGEAFMCVELMSVGAISGLGNTKICGLLSILLTGMRIPLAYFLSGTALGLNGVWWALTISSICKGIAFYFAFQREYKKKGEFLNGTKCL